MLSIILIISTICVLMIVTLNLQRMHTKYKFNLQPNCLLTQKPLLFVSGPSSLFYFGNAWNSIPELLKQHGYQVSELQLKRNVNFSEQIAEAQLMATHIIAPKGLNIDYKQLSNISLTLVDDELLHIPKTKWNLWNLLLRLHNKATGQSISPEIYGISSRQKIQGIAKSYVKLAILLAESEY